LHKPQISPNVLLSAEVKNVALFNNKAGIASIGLGICLIIVTLFAYSQISMLQSTANALGEDKTSLQDQIDQLQTEKAALQSQISALNTQIANLQSEVAGLEDQVSSLEDQVDALTTEKTNLQSEVSELESKLFETQMTLYELDLYVTARLYRETTHKSWQWIGE